MFGSQGPSSRAPVKGHGLVVGCRGPQHGAVTLAAKVENNREAVLGTGKGGGGARAGGRGARTLDDHASAQLELKRLVAVVGSVKLAAIVQGALRQWQWTGSVLWLGEIIAAMNGEKGSVGAD
jgi:hypothetical protein